MVAGAIAGDTGQDQAGGGGLKIIEAVAGGKTIGRVGGAGRSGAGGAATEVRLDVRQYRDGILRSAVFQGPGLLGAVNLAQVVDAGALLRLEPGADEIGDRDRREQADNGHHNHDLHQCEPRRPDRSNFHKKVFSNVKSQICRTDTHYRLVR